MTKYTMFLDREDVKAVEEEEQNKFIRYILDEIGIEYEDIWPDLSLDVKQKVQLRDLFKKFDIDVIEEGKELRVYVGEELIGIWYRPKYVLKKDLKARRASERLYYEMTVKFWTLFEEE